MSFLVICHNDWKLNTCNQSAMCKDFFFPDFVIFCWDILNVFRVEFSNLNIQKCWIQNSSRFHLVDPIDFDILK